ncbi:RHS repeat-associated core domain-containing protein [Rhodanobacter terrae]|uniref:RHS repeat-associated core domain-containing protein n=1 Tax=Rhodanobacter terrae TaxID=418647 RepID=A0ABW0SZ20_9GAMM
MFTGNTLLRTMLVGALALAGSMAVAHEAPTGSLAPQRYGVFEEPLIAATPPSRDESVALMQAIEAYRHAGDAGRTVALERFLATHPDNPWQASLWLDIGLADRATGRYSDAIRAFAAARRTAASSEAPAPRPVELRALSEQLVLETRLGHLQQVVTLLQETQRLGAVAEDTAAVAMAKEGLWDMQHHPQSAFQCGWIALTALWRAEGLPAVGAAPVQAMDSQHPGYSLQQLVDIAAQHHQPMMAILATNNAPIPVPAVVHWKSGHFATILAQVHGRYEVADPVMDGKAWLSAAAIRAESSGYYLVPKTASAAIADYRPVSSAVAQTVRGAGYTFSNDPHGFPSCGTGKCSCGCGQGAGGSSGGMGGAAGGTGGSTPGSGSTPSPGMPTYSISPMLVSLTLTDTPLSYTPPKGPAMDFTLRYNQLDIDQPATFTYGNLGPKWTDNWLSYVQDDPSAPGSRVLVYLPDGPGRLYSGFNGGNGTFAPEVETGAQLVGVSSSPVVYERRFPDGSKDVYAASDNSAYYPRHIFLTERIDAHGNAVKLAYDSQSRLTTVTDALNRAMTFHYDSTSQPLLLTSVSDAFGRTTALTYDAVGRLSSITDAIGMTSSVAYDGGTSITALTTPYGTSHFVTGQSGVQRWINITDADGNTSRMEFNELVPGVPFSESQVPNGINAFNAYINSRNSFYWDAQTYKLYPGDYSKAVIYHWNHLRDAVTSTTSDTLESIKYPLENRIWYNHPGDRAGVSGSLSMPSVLGRVLPDSSTQLTQNSYNAQGKLTRSVDPAGLETDYTYAPSQVDVVQIDRRATGGYHTVESFTYDNQHDVLSHTDETGAVTRHTYNANGQVLSTADALGHVTQYAYDANGYLVSKTDANGHTITYTYDAEGRLASETDPLHRTTRYSYDALDRLVHTVYPDGSSEVTTWDKLDKAAFRDRDGHTTSYAYDAMRHLVRETDPLGNATASTYYPNGLRATRTDANGHTTTWQRDLEGRVVAVVEPGGATMRTTYDSSDRRSSVTNALGQTTTFAYDTQDRLVRTIDPNGVIIDNTYTPRGWLAARTVHANANGSPSPNDATTTVSYDAAGDVVAVADPDGVKTSFVLDADHRRITTNDALGNTQLHDYDAVGNLTTQADAAAGSSDPSWLQSYEYDAANQRVATIDAYNRTTRVRYDLNGAVRDTRDPRHIHTQTDYDPMDRLLRTVEGRRGDDEHDGDRGDHDGDRDDRDHDGDHDHGGDGDHHDGNVAVTRYHYDADGRLIQVTDPNRLDTVYAYDPVGQLVRQDSPDTGTTTYAYDTDGNRTRTVDARQVETDRSYDALHRVVTVTYPSNAALNASYYYDEAPSVTGCTVSYPVGHVSRMIDTSGTTSYCYDVRGNLIAQHRVIAGTAYVTSYAYTLGNRLSQLTYPSGVMLAYSHDLDGRASAISVQAPGQASATPLVSSVSYLPFGPVNAVVFGDGHQSLQRGYDLNYWGTDITGLGLSLHVRRDGDGNIVALHQGREVGPSAEQRYRYDSLQRLTHTTGPFGWFGDHYAYNATGDRLAKDSMGSWPTRYDYQPGTHRLSGIGHPGQWHLQPVLSDAAGNIVQMPQDGQILTLNYGANDRLLQVAKDGRVAGAYVYDANGRRAQKVTFAGTQQFVYDNTANLLGSYEPASQTGQEYVWMDGVLVATIDIAHLNGMSIHYVGTDFMGVPRSVMDARGSLVWSWDFAGEAFGDSRPLGSYSFNLRFPGQYHDMESGLNYNAQRDYNPSTGRYLESDPTGLRGGKNTYTYANGNPLSFEDPTGESAYAGGQRTSGASTILCDGMGGIMLFVLPQSPCFDDCVAVHENSHKQDVLRSNPTVCVNQPLGTAIQIEPISEEYFSEVRAYKSQLDCLRKKLAKLKDCDNCKKPIEHDIEIQQKRLDGYEYWLKTHLYL